MAEQRVVLRVELDDSAASAGFDRMAGRARSASQSAQRKSGGVGAAEVAVGAVIGGAVLDALKSNLGKISQAIATTANPLSTNLERDQAQRRAGFGVAGAGVGGVAGGLLGGPFGAALGASIGQQIADAISEAFDSSEIGEKLADSIAKATGQGRVSGAAKAGIRFSDEELRDIARGAARQGQFQSEQAIRFQTIANEEDRRRSGRAAIGESFLNGLRTALDPIGSSVAARIAARQGF